MSDSNKKLNALNDSPVDHIMNDQITGPALDLFDLFRKKDLSRDTLNGFLDALPEDVSQEREKLNGLLEGSNTHVDINLTSKSNVLLWAAGLGHVYATRPKNTIRSHSLWKSLIDNEKVSSSLGATARFIDLASTNRKTTMGWGVPGSWFWFSPERNHINIDLFHTLLTGFADDPDVGMPGMAHASGVMMHEVGHSQLTTRFTDRMQSLINIQTELREASEGRDLTEDEFLDLVRTKKEFDLRMNVFNAAEDNCVNQYAANYSRDFPHDFGASLNVCNIILQGTGQYLKYTDAIKNQAPPTDDVQKAKKAFANLNKAIVMSFYGKNGLFDLKDEDELARLGINSTEITHKQDDQSSFITNAFFNRYSSDFEELMALNVGSRGISQQQPRLRDSQLLRSIFARSVDNYAERRCRIIDEIWDKFAAHHADIIIDDAVKNALQKLEEKKQQNQENGKKPDDQGDKADQDNSGDSRSDQDQGASAQQKSSDNQGQEEDRGEKQKASGSKSGQGEGGQSEISDKGQAQERDDASDNSDDTPIEEAINDAVSGGETLDEGETEIGGDTEREADLNNPETADPKLEDDAEQDNIETEAQNDIDDEDLLADQKFDENDGEPKNSATNADGKMPDDVFGQDDETSEQESLEVNVEGVGEVSIDDGDPLPENPQDAKEREHAGAKSEFDQDEDNAKTVRELAREARRKERENDPNYQGGKPSMNMSDNESGGREAGIDLANLARNADWSEWRKQIGMLEPVIHRVSDDFTYIRKRQKQHTRTLSKSVTELPRGGGDLIRQLDQSRHLNKVMKMNTGQRLEREDLKTWRQEKISSEPTSVELWIMTDGSGSMCWDSRPIDAAVQSMAILYEAGKRADFDVFAGMWGDSTLRILAGPDEREHSIGKNFQAAKNGINSGTMLSASFHQAIERSGQQETNRLGQVKRFAGMTHFLILSDGELNNGDIRPTADMITKLFKHGPSVSVDIAVLGRGRGSQMQDVVSRVKNNVPGAAIDLIHASDPQYIPVLLAQQIKRRFESSNGDVRAVPDSLKRESFRNVVTAMKSANLV